jgi:hypothetical protein
MSDLLLTEAGRSAILTAQRFLLQRRLSKYFKRNLVIDYNQWLATGEFTLSTLLGQLNKARDPEILNLFNLLGMVGGLPASVSDMSIYVNPVTGSDITGTGTASNPYASLWFIGTLPKRIDHSYRILLSSSIAPNSDMILDFDFGPFGSLSFIGVGAPTTVAGPFTVATTGNIGANAGRFVQATAPIGADPSNNFVMMTSGVDINKVAGIHSLAAADTISVLEGALSSIAPGDTMNIVRPTVKLTVRNLICCCHNRAAYASDVNNGSRLNFVNLQVEITNSANTELNCLVIDNTCSQSMSFVQLIPPDAGNALIRSNLNDQSSKDSALTTLSTSGISNLHPYTTDPTPAGLTIQDIGKAYPVTAEGGMIKWVGSRGRIDWRKTAELRSVSAEWINAAYVNSNLYKVLVQGTTPGDGSGGAIELNTCHVQIRGLIALNSDNIITVRSNSEITVSETGADATYSTITGYAFWIGGIARVEVDDDGALLVGGTNVINFVTVNPTVPAPLPAVWSVADDTQFSSVKRMGS